MKISCSILITHVNTPIMLRTIVDNIHKFSNSKIDYEILIADQSNDQTYKQICQEYIGEKDVKILRFPKIDPGYPLTMGLQYAQGEYYCTLDSDSFPIHRNWLLTPIRLIQNFGFSMVGHRTGLDKAYPHKGIFFELNNYFRVSKTDFAKKIADTVGFMRPDARVKSNFSPKDKEYEQFSIGEPPFDKNYGDVGVVANWYIDKNKLGTKLSLKMNKCLGTCKEYGGDYGMVIDDLVFHLVLGYADDYMSKKEQEKLGEDFLTIKELINNKASSDLIDQLVNKTRPSNEQRMRTFISNNNFYYEPVSNEMNSIIDKIKMEE